VAFSVTVHEGVDLPLICTRVLSVPDFYQFSQNPVKSNEVFQDQSSGRPSRHNAHLAILPHFLCQIADNTCYSTVLISSSRDNTDLIKISAL
jgi:hypothetical protein